MSRDFRGITGPEAPLFHGSPDNGSAPVMQMLFFGDSGLSVAQERSEAAISQACYQHP